MKAATILNLERSLDYHHQMSLLDDDPAVRRMHAETARQLQEILESAMNVAALNRVRRDASVESKGALALPARRV